MMMDNLKYLFCLYERHKRLNNHVVPSLFHPRFLVFISLFETVGQVVLLGLSDENGVVPKVISEQSCRSRQFYRKCYDYNEQRDSCCSLIYSSREWSRMWVIIKFHYQAHNIARRNARLKLEGAYRSQNCWPMGTKTSRVAFTDVKTQEALVSVAL